MPITYETIASTVLGSTSVTIDISSIPSTYTDLRLVLIGNSSSTATVGIRFNDDATLGSYGRMGMQGYGTSTFAAQSNSRTAIDSYYEMYDTANSRPSMYLVDISNYASTSMVKQVLGFMSSDQGTSSGGLAFISGVWNSTSAINKITLGTNFSSFAFTVGTTVSLYGIKRF